MTYSEYPIVTVITLTYNHFENIRKTIDSVFLQDYHNIEYIICDDGSFEFPNEIIKEYIKKGKKIKLICHENVGTVKNFNFAINNSVGKYIIPLSGNDYFSDKNIVSKIVDKFENTQADILTARRACISNTGEVMRVLPAMEKVELLKSEKQKEVFEELCISSFISGASTYYSRKVLDVYDGFNEEYKLIEDFPFYMQYLLDGGRIYYLDCITINYDMNGVTSQKKISELLVKDRKKYYKDLVFPNSKEFSYIKKKKLLFYYFKACESNNIFIKFMGWILCGDYVLIKLIKKIFKRKEENYASS